MKNETINEKHEVNVFSRGNASEKLKPSYSLTLSEGSLNIPGKNELKILNDSPQIIQDVKLFKIVFMPLELFVLKYVFTFLRAINTRDLYTNAIMLSFFRLFAPDSSELQPYKHLINELAVAGYGLGSIEKKEQKKIMDVYLKECQGLSPTKISKLQLGLIKKYHSRIPSYDKFKGIFEKFERLGIFYKVGKEGKGIIYRLNLKFYNTFKDKRKEILALS